jgi:hypothetical protein
MTTPYERFLESKAVSAPERGYTTKRKPRPSAEWLSQQYEVQSRDCVQIARDLEIDPKTAWEWIRAAGIETRKRGFGHPANLFIKGQLSGFAGQSHTAESRAKIAQTSQARGAVPYLKNGVHWLKGTSGAVNPHWRGGTTPERQTFYRSPEWKACVKIVWKRDNATCQRCALDYRSVDRKTRTFDIHHVDSFAIVERRADPDNLILFCDDCHDWVHSRQNTARLFLGDGHDRQFNEAA